MTDEDWVAPRPEGNNTHFGAGEKYEIRVGASLYGARSFLAHESGWLSGVTYKKIWQPGVNKAGCYRVTGWNVQGVGIVPERPGVNHDKVFTDTRDEDGMPVVQYVRRGWRWKLGTEAGITLAEPKPVYGNDGDLDHDLVPCGCGLHGYYRGSLDFAYDKTAVNGIVRAFGRMRLHKKGFRASHAEIVALYVPEENLYRRLRPSDWQHVSHGLRHAGKPIEYDLMEAVSGRYPEIPIYRDLDEMLLFHPTEEPS